MQNRMAASLMTCGREDMLPHQPMAFSALVDQPEVVHFGVTRKMRQGPSMDDGHLGEVPCCNQGAMLPRHR